MKSFLSTLLILITFSSFGQMIPDSSARSAYSFEDVKFKSTGIVLAGTIYRPKHAYAAVVIVHGSGQEKRLVGMASLLARNGIAVLTYDKRGVGKSEGVYAGPEVGTNNIDSANINLLALDASAACNALLAHLPSIHGPLGMMGFSQAGWVIPIAAEKNSHVNFMVLFSGPVVTTLEQLRFQFYTNGSSNFWETHTEAETRRHISSDPDRYQFVDTNPRETLSALQVSGLWLFGGKDIQIPVQLSIEQLNALKAQGKHYEYRLFPELGHNTAFSEASEPVYVAIRWIKSLNGRVKR